MTTAKKINIIQIMDYITSNVEGFNPQEHEAIVYGYGRTKNAKNQYNRYDVNYYPTYILTYNNGKCFGGVSLEKLTEDCISLKIYPNERFLTYTEAGIVHRANFKFPLKLIIQHGLKEYNENKYYTYTMRNLTREERIYYDEYRKNHSVTKKEDKIEYEQADPSAFV